MYKLARVDIAYYINTRPGEQKSEENEKEEKVENFEQIWIEKGTYNIDQIRTYMWRTGTRDFLYLHLIFILNFNKQYINYVTCPLTDKIYTIRKYQIT